MSVTLREMRDDEVPGWVDRHRAWYAEDLVAHAGLPADVAHAKAARDTTALLPGGRPKKESALLVVEDDGKVVGSLWFARQDGPEGPYAFLYAIEIDEEHRGRGVGRAAMRLFEDEARSRGLPFAMLNVFGGNERARGLYRSLGWEEASVHMRKQLA
jgi:ribosomal protein S18 acetylase RimI-like enzyme